MSDRSTLYIFHIYRQDGSSLFLHSFSKVDKVVPMLEKSVVEGRYGREPRVESLTFFRNELYRQIESGVKRWIGEARFIPRFVISALVFVVVYFFMSYVIRDPLPVIDELAIALGGAILAYFLQGRRDLSSKLAAKKRLDLRLVVDKITFKDSPFVKQVETALHKNESGQFEEVVRRIVEPAGEELDLELREEAGQFIRLLETRFDFKRLKREEKLFQRYSAGGHLKELKRLLESRRLDFPLYAVYKNLKKTVPSQK